MQFSLAFVFFISLPIYRMNSNLAIELNVIQTFCYFHFRNVNVEREKKPNSKLIGLFRDSADVKTGFIPIHKELFFRLIVVGLAKGIQLFIFPRHAEMLSTERTDQPNG